MASFPIVFILAVLSCTDVHGRLSKPRIVGGQATTIEKHPYQVSIIYIDTHNCGGTIVNSYHIITAAHCTHGFSTSDLLVRAGSTESNSGGQIKRVSKIFEHQNYDFNTYDYDISILRLSDGLDFGKGVAAVTLPAQSVDNIPGGLVGTATGWGRLSEGGSVPLELQQVNLPTLATEDCKLVYGASVTTRMFCAGYVEGRKDTCEGDSGGPFVYQGVLMGITSWGDGCGAKNSPGIYTKVQYFRTFIDSIVNS